MNQEGPVPITPSVQFSPFFLHSDSTTTGLMGPKVFLPYVFGLLCLEDSKLLHNSFTGPKAYLVGDAKVCLLATEDTYLVVWWGKITLSKTLPQTLQDMWPAPAGRWASPFTAVRNTWKGLPAVYHVKKTGDLKLHATFLFSCSIFPCLKVISSVIIVKLNTMERTEEQAANHALKCH